jgi:acyl-CoA reductase-like NAD-dependent aldehyde dehydrogenase/nicotinamidase-related amidase
VSARVTTTALLLLDLQNDFLERPGLSPDPAALCARAAWLLGGFRERRLPIAHAYTVTRGDGSDRMPHWQRRGVFACVEGSRGAAPPAPLAPRQNELVCRKQHYDAFADPRLAAWLREHGIRRLVLAGLYLHACVRSTALAGYERGFEVCVVEDAVGTTEPLHGELTRRWLAERAACFASASETLAELDAPVRDAVADPGLPIAWIAGAARQSSVRRSFVHRDPCRTARVLARVPLGGAAEVEEAARAAQGAQTDWAAVAPPRRAELLECWAAELEAQHKVFVELLVREVAKPRRFAEEEVGRAVTHARVAAELARDARAVQIAPGVTAASLPVGVVGLVTPWNNPIAIPVGKIGPALAFGNGVVLKPSPRAAETALAIVQSLERSGLPEGLVNVVLGAGEAGRALCREAAISAVSLTGSLESGRAAAGLCAESLKPLQAELGGNNAAIVLADAELERVVPDLVRAAFGFAGQRCTAIRRFVVERSIAPRFEALAVEAAAALRLGEPDDEATDVGPLISTEKREQVLRVIERARAAGARLVAGGGVPASLAHGAWLEPALLADADPRSRIAQEETFGPLALLQVADDLEDAIALANGVPQGLVLGVHTEDARARARILEAAQAGILQLGPGPLAVHPRAPFAGWKASGLGPPEHGAWDAWFYARIQARYQPASC